MVSVSASTRNTDPVPQEPNTDFTDFADKKGPTRIPRITQISSLWNSQ
jgi:hypothetical protein